jgi:hypothetical protein
MSKLQQIACGFIEEHKEILFLMLLDLTFINKAVHTGWITNTKHVIQFLDGTVKSLGHLTFGLQH